MECKKIKEWVDALVDERERMKELRNFSEKISLINRYESYHMYRGIEVVAAILGVPLECESFTGCDLIITTVSGTGMFCFTNWKRSCWS